MVGKGRHSPRHRITGRCVGIPAGMDRKFDQGAGVVYLQGEREIGSAFGKAGNFCFQVRDLLPLLSGEKDAHFRNGERAGGRPPTAVRIGERSRNEEELIKSREGFVAIDFEQQEIRSGFQRIERNGAPAEMILRLPEGWLSENSFFCRFAVQFQHHRSGFGGGVADQQRVRSGFGRSQSIAHPLIEAAAGRDSFPFAERNGLQIFVTVKFLRFEPRRGRRE